MTDLLPVQGVSEAELLRTALALEKKSEHPLAKAIISYAEGREMVAEEATQFQVMPGNGLSGIFLSIRMFYRR